MDFRFDKWWKLFSIIFFVLELVYIYFQPDSLSYNVYLIIGIWGLFTTLLWFIKEAYMDSERILYANDLKKYPDFTRDHAVYGLWGFARIIRRYLYED